MKMPAVKPLFLRTIEQHSLINSFILLFLIFRQPDTPNRSAHGKIPDKYYTDTFALIRRINGKTKGPTMKITDFQTEELLHRIREYDSIPQMWAQVTAQYADRPAVKDGDTICTYRELDEAVCRFRGFLFRKGYRSGGEIRMISQCSIGFIKAFLAAETLGLTVTVLPADSTADALSPTEYCDDLSGEDCGIVLPDGASPAAVMFTGGTTGIPKGAVLSHRCMMIAVRNACYGYPNVFCQKYLHVLPMHHVFGLIRSMLTCLGTGGTLLLCPDPHKMFDIAMTENPDIAVLVPLLVDRGVSMSRKYGRNMFGGAMKTIITGAAPVAERLAGECKALGITLCPGYGLTETACLVSGNPDMEGHPGSVGLLYPDQEVRFADGELQVRGKNVMNGYTGGENCGLTPEGWFATGDIGYLDKDGFLYLMGRKKEMLLTANGENVYPVPVEARFNALPEVAECELFEGEDGKLHLEVFPRTPEQYASPSSPQTEAFLSMLAAVNEGLPKHERASEITIRTTDFPRTKSLKKKRRETSHGQI